MRKAAAGAGSTTAARAAGHTASKDGAAKRTTASRGRTKPVTQGSARIPESGEAKRETSGDYRADWSPEDFDRMPSGDEAGGNGRVANTQPAWATRAFENQSKRTH